MDRTLGSHHIQPVLIFHAQGRKKSLKVFSKTLAISFKGCFLNCFSPTHNPSSQGLGIAIQNKRYNCRNLLLIYPQLVRNLSFRVCLASFAYTCKYFWQNNFLSLHCFHSGGSFHVFYVFRHIPLSKESTPVL